MGRSEAVPVYEPIAGAGAAERAAEWERVMAHIESGQFGNAVGLLESMPSDSLQQKYLEKLAEVSQSQEPWDGVWRLTEK